MGFHSDQSTQPCVLVIYGPGSEPIDDVRRITNFSTGELGVVLCGALRKRGLIVHAFRANGTRHPSVTPESDLPFESGSDLLRSLEAFPLRNRVSAVFHLAALPDFRVDSISDASGQTIARGKIPSQTESLHLVLRKAPKVIDRLRSFFPDAHLTGWKYELEGSRTEALRSARRLLERADLDCCVVNGAAYGPGFGVLDRTGQLVEYRNKPDLASALAVGLHL